MMLYLALMMRLTILLSTLYLSVATPSFFGMASSSLSSSSSRLFTGRPIGPKPPLFTVAQGGSVTLPRTSRLGRRRRADINRPAAAMIGGSVRTANSFLTLRRSRSESQQQQQQTIVPPPRHFRTTRLLFVSASNNNDSPAQSATAQEGDKKTTDDKNDMSAPLTKEKAETANRETSDKLIDVFLQQEQDAWKHLLGFSTQWWEMSDGVFARIAERANQTADPKEQLELLRLGRQLKETHDEVFENRRVWRELRNLKPDELESYVSANMERIATDSFFEYLRDVVGRADHIEDNSVSDLERSQVRDLANKLLDLTQDLAIGVDSEVRKNMENILRAGSKEDAKKEIDKLAESGELDPRYLALMSKAYAGGKDTWFTKEDHEETTLYMYEQMRVSMRKQQPLEIRLLKYVLAFPTPRERKEALEEVLTPGVRFDDEGWYTAETTTPEAMLMRVEDLLRKYRMNMKRFGELEPRPIYRALDRRGDMDKDDIMRDLVVDSVYMYVPEVMERLREIRTLIKSEFAGQLPQNSNNGNPQDSSGKLIVTPDNQDVLFQGDNFMPF
mmetsp:Transcript_48423/g.80169  ORF Transcript_48423/g.80169 Transcript_48423/m.80169 type:complete len:559 (-) Transcript_48423:287-1963(-)